MGAAEARAQPAQRRLCRAHVVAAKGRGYQLITRQVLLRVAVPQQHRLRAAACSLLLLLLLLQVQAAQGGGPLALGFQAACHIYGEAVQLKAPLQLRTPLRRPLVYHGLLLVGTVIALLKQLQPLVDAQQGAWR